MLAWLDRTSYTPPSFAPPALGPAPVVPAPHPCQKLKMLAPAEPVRPTYIFDLCLHGAPATLLLIKWLRARRGGDAA